MERKYSKNMYIVLAIMLGIAIFSISYYITAERFKNNKGNYGNGTEVKNNTNAEDKMTLSSGENYVLDSKCEILFYTKYKKSGDLILVKKESASTLGLKDKKQVEEKYKTEGYKIQEGSKTQIKLQNEVEKYVPNKYVLGIYGEYLAIFKTDKNGDMHIESEKEDITEKKIEHLKEQDIYLLTTGSKYFQCDTRDEVLARLEDYE